MKSIILPRLLILLITLLLVFPPAYGQNEPTEVEPVRQTHSQGETRLILKVDKPQLSVGDQFELQLRIIAPNKTNVSYSQVRDTLGPFKIESQQNIGPLPLDDKRQQWIREYTLVPEQAGELELPALTIYLRDLSEQPASDRTTRLVNPNEQTIITEPVMITVASVVPEDADITKPKDIAPPVSFPLPEVDKIAPIPWLKIIAANIGLLVLLGLIGWWWQNRPQKTTPKAALAAHERALQELNGLQITELDSQEKVDQFHVRASNILRTYIADRFSINAPAQTTEEFLVNLAEHNNAQDIIERKDLLQTFLRRCDLVKFASNRPIHTEIQQTLASAKNFVEQTAATSAAASSS